jgi:acid phosphatase type 7
MSGDISRRELLKAAGGLTFLALVPAARGRFSLSSLVALDVEPPLFTALPYVQPGDNSRLVADHERVVLAWQTDATAADFGVVFGPTARYGRTAEVTVSRRWAGDKEDGEGRLNYTAAFPGLRLGTTYHYRVNLGRERSQRGTLPPGRRAAPPRGSWRSVTTPTATSATAPSRTTPTRPGPIS